MGSSVYDQLTREHPAYRTGFNAGRDVGLVVALTAITTELTRQVYAAADVSVTSADASAALPHEFAAGRLLAVARIVGAAFRTRP
jgi:hypothetical protein